LPIVLIRLFVTFVETSCLNIENQNDQSMTFTQ